MNDICIATIGASAIVCILIICAWLDMRNQRNEWRARFQRAAEDLTAVDEQLLTLERDYRELKTRNMNITHYRTQS